MVGLPFPPSKFEAPVSYRPLINERAQAELFETLARELDWSKHEDLPRAEYWTNTFGLDYTYGRGAGRRTYLSDPSHPAIDKMRHNIKVWSSYYLEGCFLNYYRDGKDSLGWHADDDPGIDHEKPIVVITLGAGRVIEFKNKTPGSHPERLMLEPGSILFMHPGMQSTHFHRIPKVKEEIGPRISMTFRGLKG